MHSNFSYNIINVLNTSDNGVSYDVARTKQLIEDKKELWKKMLLNKYEEKEEPKDDKNKKSRSLMIIRRKRIMPRGKKHMPFQTSVFPFLSWE